MAKINQKLFKPNFNRIFRGGPFGFPLSLDFLFATNAPGVWFEPSPATCFTDTAGTTPAGVGDAVARINDLSGSGNHAIQATEAKRPILQQTTGGLWYLSFDGVTQSMSTSALTPGTDKVQLFAGARKLSDGNRGILAELTATPTLNSFTLFNPASTFGPYSWVSRGSSNVTLTTSFYVAPVTHVVSGLGDVSGDFAAFRVNGNKVAVSSADQGTGNFSNAPLYIGARNNASLFFNGELYCLAVRFGENLSAQKIRGAERYVAEKTGVNL